MCQRENETYVNLWANTMLFQKWQTAIVTINLVLHTIKKRIIIVITRGFDGGTIPKRDGQEKDTRPG